MSGFVCNMGAMNQMERLRYAELSKHLFAKAGRRELDNGYVFTFTSDITLAALAEWVSLEKKCCPFIDFHIEVPSGDRSMSLRLTGDLKIKEFIRRELRW